MTPEAARQSMQSMFLLLIVSGLVVWASDALWLQLVYLAVAGPVNWALRAPLDSGDV